MKNIIITLIGFTFFFVGCSSYKDANLAIFTLTTIVDIDEDNKPVVYMETFRSHYSQDNATEKGERIIFIGRGDTISEAILDLNQKASYKIITTHNKALIFTDKAAKYGLDNFLDVFIRDQEFLLRPYIMIYEGEPKKLLDTRLEQEEFVGLYLEELVKNKFVIAIKYPEKLYEYVNLRTIGSKTDVINLIKLEGEEPTEIFLKEGAVIKEDIMIDILTKREMKIYSLMMNEHSKNYITIAHPQIDDKYVSLEIIKTKVKTDVKYDGKPESIVKFNKNLSLRLSFIEAQQSINLTDKEIRQAMEEGIKKMIIQESEALFQKYKTKNIDIFEVQAAFERKYPHEDSKDIIKKTQLDMKVEVFIEGSSDTQNFDSK